MDQIDFTDFFQTRSSASDFTSRLSVITEDIFKSGFSLESTLMKLMGIEKKEKFMSILRENNVSTESHSALKEFINKMIEHITGLPVFSLKLAFDPSEGTLKKISEWFVVNAKKQVLLDITVDRSLIAGAAISFKGEYLNFSIKPQFEKIIADVLNAKSENTTPLSPDNSVENNMHAQNQ